VPVDLNILFSGLGVALQPMASVKHLRLRVRPSRYWGLTDPILMQRILMNLAHNALRYTERGTVLVACRKIHGGSHLRIEVWDSGIGISPEHQTQVFKEFFQVANPGRDRSYGLGLGLNIVERSAKLLGHELTVLSQVGCGTRIAITLPCVAASEHLAPLIASEAVSVRDAAGQRILVIEDDDFAREAMHALLDSWGYQVNAVSTQSQGYASLAQDGMPDIIVSDYRLGHGENGIDAIAGLRKTAGYDIAACLMSGDTDAELMRLATQAGLTLLHKPVRPAKLRSLLRRLSAGANQADLAASIGT
jgi:CheY-like chemotaxis protein